MTYTTKLNRCFEVRFNVGISHSFLLLIAFESYSTERQLLETMFLKPIYQTGWFSWKKSEFTVSKRRTRGSQNFHGNRVWKYSKACSFEDQKSRRADVMATTKFIWAILSSNLALNSSRVTTVGSIKIIATYGSSRLRCISLVVRILQKWNKNFYPLQKED